MSRLLKSLLQKLQPLLAIEVSEKCSTNLQGNEFEGGRGCNNPIRGRWGRRPEGRDPRSEVGGGGGQRTGTLLRYVIIPLPLPWFVVFQDLGSEIPAFVVVVLARLNSFETLRLKTFGKNKKLHR